ncbi:HNH endonuclease signature motif containing protein [Saccharopolyspora rosea]|uniref:DUF222 domain-containing protein n=1 Tax=Saccharopolyspora rosea TaxID=524884 RepID=A0ABW3FUE5_9PSEU|nr:HNH endonuclease signature motif containing protein [Saccharopolyspora rosea]
MAEVVATRGAPVDVDSPQETVLSSPRLVAEIQETERVLRAALARQLALLAEVERRGVPREAGARSTESWLRALLNIDHQEASSRVRVARRVEERVDPSGAPLPADLPATAHALRAGEISLAHARVVVDGMRKLPSWCDARSREEIERVLAGQAHALSPRELARLAERIRYLHDEEGALADEDYQVEARELHHSVGADGMTVIRARLDRESGAKFRAVFEPLAAPRPQEDGAPDPRTAAKRNADAFAGVLDRLLDAEWLPRPGGQSPQLTVTVGFDDLRKDVGDAARMPGTLDATGQPITPENVRRIACDADVLPVVLGSDGVPLAVGRAERTAPVHLRVALLHRDGVCAFPGCDRPPGTPQAHHIISWIDGGSTDLDNMVMLCGHHHRTVHRQDWAITVVDGLPVFIPPSTVDPIRRPRPGGRAEHHDHGTILREAIPAPRHSEDDPARPHSDS